MLLCNYYGGWKSPPESSVTWQGASPWDQFAGYPERLPEYGPADEDDQAIIDRHLRQARAAGIDAFGTCWYADEYLSYGLRRMTESKSRSPVKCFAMWDNASRGDVRKQSRSWLLASAAKLAPYFASSRYLRINSRPVVMLFSTADIDACIRAEKSIPSGYMPTTAERGELLGAIKGAMGQVYLVVQIYSNDWIATPGIDAATFYNIRSLSVNGVTRLAHNYAEMTTGCERGWAYWGPECRKRGIAYWPTAMAGWDRRPWGGTTSDPLHDNCTPPNDAAITTHLRKAFTAAVSSNVLLCAWNELGEGSFVQPSQGYPTRWQAVRAAMP